MLLILLLTSLSLVLALVCSYSLYRSKKLSSNISQKESEIKKIRQELTTLQEKLQFAMEDPVTHLSSWALFEDRFKQNLNESVRYQLIMAVLFVDIHDFKIINEALGHDAGDQILQEAAKRLQDCIRRVDSVTRYTKDIFVVMLTRLNKAESAAIVVQRILQAFSRPLEITQQELNINVSIGAAIYPHDAQDAASLLRNADHALQSAKENNQSYQFYHEKIHADSKREFALSAGLKRGNLLQEFIIYYQPVFNTKEKTIFAVEAQLHWQHEKLGLIKPEELFEYAEKQGKINFITLWILEKACKQFLSWRSIGLKPESLMVSLSVNQLQNSQFIYQLSKVLQNCSFNPEWLVLEIRDTQSYAAFDVLEKGLNMLKYLHIQLAVNNASLFSMNKLKNISVDYLVLNNELIDVDEANQPEFLKAVVNLARSLHLKIIVKGVESESQTELLTASGCYLIQGNVPMLEKEMAEHMI